MSADAQEGGWNAMEDMGKLQPSTIWENKGEYGWSSSRLAKCLKYQQHNRSNYHLLSRALCQDVAVPQIIDVNVLDVISVFDVNLGIEATRSIDRGGGCGLRCGTGSLHGSVSRIIAGAYIPFSPSGWEEHRRAESLFLLATER